MLDVLEGIFFVFDAVISLCDGIAWLYERAGATVNYFRGRPH
jgi:hypothetical protein